ncbi:apolipoprotein Da, duplicate 2 [Clupea harengus]|uniref:Apolipoprotein D n=1 Tax=Clupea harengus TaxID=7950 RepID=A0A6P3VFF8_CLUHA|nr:apolipoprotein Da, duplicate 2 [Clupea harengus]
MQTLQVLSLTLLPFLMANAQVLHPGRCPVPPVKENFDVSSYMGRWYEIQKLPSIFQKGECGQATYTLGDGVVHVLNAELLADGTVSQIEGSAKPVDPAQPAKLAVTFFPGSPPGPYWVLDTDYDNYALVYGCENYGGLFYADFAWILSRSPTLTEETIEQLHNIMTSNGISINKMTTTNQSICSSMPQ